MVNDCGGTISGPRMWAWVRIPLLTPCYKRGPSWDGNEEHNKASISLQLNIKWNARAPCTSRGRKLAKLAPVYKDNLNCKRFIGAHNKLNITHIIIRKILGPYILYIESINSFFAETGFHRNSKTCTKLRRI